MLDSYYMLPISNDERSVLEDAWIMTPNTTAYKTERHKYVTTAKGVAFQQKKNHVTNYRLPY